MQPFVLLTSPVIPLPNENVDTDQIIPARYLKVTDRNGLAEGLFSSWRYLPNGNPDPKFPLNMPIYQGAQILLAGDNFACGSSREHAPWALLGWGIRAVISTSFADIFRNNAMKNGLLPLVVDSDTHHELFSLSAAQPGLTVSIDLPGQRLSLPGRSVSFPIDAFNKTCMIEGVDQLGYLLRFEKEIQSYEQMRAGQKLPHRDESISGLQR
jgi:3-isopropylmalate/(R)-2-methylmalate dehydratase small subunit